MFTTLLSSGRHHLPRTSQPTRRRAAAVVTAAALLTATAALAIAEVTTPNPTHLVAVGPISGEHGYPSWYQDSNGLRLEQCLDLEDPYCDPAFLRGEMPNPDGSIAFPENWPLESFYFLAGASVDIGAGSAILTAGLEATMANGATVDGDQVVFGRLRFDIDFPGAGTYEVIHPYGVDTFEVSAAEADGFRYVEDITPAPGNFGLALRSRINPFLIAEGGLITTTDGRAYVGDPAVPTTVTGSPHDTNYFRVDQVGTDGSRTTIAETNQFSLMGKVSTNSGITPHAAVLIETATDRYLDVFATTDAGDSVSVEGAGLVKTTLDADGGRYFGRIPLAGGAPTSVTFSNDSDKPVATQTMTVTDRVAVTSATYNTDSDVLTVTASSSDEVGPPTLTVEGLTAPDGAPITLAGGTATLNTTAPPATVTVSSTGGGSDSAPVVVTGATTTPPAVTQALITGPTEVLAGSQVTLTSASLNADTLLWTQEAGTLVALGDATATTVTFTAPSEEGTLAFTLTATGPGGEHTTEPFEVIVVTTLPAPVAAAAGTPNPALVGQTVTLSSAGSTGAVTYAWSQVRAEGEPVVTINPTDQNATFAMPEVPVTFQLEVTSADLQTATATVTVNPVLDALTVAAGAQYRADKQEWRINGTATVTNNNTVTVYLRDPVSGGKLAGFDPIGSGVVATAVAPATTGDWTVRVRGSSVIPPQGVTQVIVESTRGGSAVGIFARR